MNKYDKLKNKQQEEFNSFPMAFAYSEEQFKEGLKKLGLTENETDKIVATSCAGFIRKSDVQKFLELTDKLEEELNNAINEDTTGEGFIFDMFVSELQNHEFSYTGSIDDTLMALCLSEKDFEENKALLNGLNLAIKYINKGE